MSKYIRNFLPYCGERTKKINTLVLHCSAHDARHMIRVLEENKLSAHYIVDPDGKIYQLVSEKLRAWHAGESYWRGETNLNHSSIGIELCSLSMGQSEYSPKQIRQTVKLCRQIIKHYQIPQTNIVAHSDIAPRRKPDPGKAFPWPYFAQCGIGLWYDMKDSHAVDEEDVAFLLAAIGYDVSDLPAASYAFCRHFAPQFVTDEMNIRRLIEEIYPRDFVLPRELMPVLRACAFKYRLHTKKSRA